MSSYLRTMQRAAARERHKEHHAYPRGKRTTPPWQRRQQHDPVAYAGRVFQSWRKRWVPVVIGGATMETPAEKAA